MREFQKAFQTMVEENQDLFDTFTAVHDAYVLNPEMNKEKFNSVGGEVVEIIRDHERKLCSQMGKGQFSKFTHTLSDKFWGEVRKKYAKIDFVGVR
jgi:hypothetical protein